MKRSGATGQETRRREGCCPPRRTDAFVGVPLVLGLPRVIPVRSFCRNHRAAQSLGCVCTCVFLWGCSGCGLFVGVSKPPYKYCSNLADRLSAPLGAAAAASAAIQILLDQMCDSRSSSVSSSATSTFTPRKRTSPRRFRSSGLWPRYVKQCRARGRQKGTGEPAGENTWRLPCPSFGSASSVRDSPLNSFP